MGRLKSKFLKSIDNTPLN